MNEREQIQKALLPIHASERLLEEVLDMIEKQTERKSVKLRRSGKMILAAAAVLALLVVTAFAADYVINRREIYFFDTLEEMAAGNRAEGDTFSYSAPASMAVNRDMETVAEHVAWVMERGGYYGEDETVLSDETSGAGDALWERRLVTQFWEEDLGSVTAEYLTGDAYAERVVIDGLLDWDVSSALKTMTPEEDAQIVSAVRDAVTGDVICADALLGYATAEGRRFQIDYRYDAIYLNAAEEYILSSARDYCAVYTTGDGVEVLIEEYDGQVWAKAVNERNAVYIYTTGCTVKEMEAILNGLGLHVPLSVEG